VPCNNREVLFSAWIVSRAYGKIWEWEFTSIFITDKPIFSSERILHKDKKSLIVGLKGLDAKIQ
jgi:hypothetical protein